MGSCWKTIPFAKSTLPKEPFEPRAERVQATMIKAVREAKERSSWSNPQVEYEAALGRFVAGALDGSKPNPFLAEMSAFVARLAR